MLSPDHYKLLRNAVTWATNEQPVVEVEGPGILDLSVWQQKKSLTVHLVNLTNPMLMKGPIREFIPVGKQEVKVRLPEGAKPTRVRLLANGSSVAPKTRGGYLTVTVQSITDHEVVAVDFA